jgi:cell wall-associated NlpC family hydrolase
MGPANDSAAPNPARAALPKGDPLFLSDRIRFALLVLTVVACVAARAGGALGAVDHRHQHYVSHATAVARKEARIVSFARRFVGVRYSYGGSSPRSGFDCSGFTRFVYGHFGIALPHYSGAQFALGRRVLRARLQPGDLLFFDGLGHVGLYVGRGLFLHAPHAGARVSLASLGGWYSGRFTGARRLL